MSFEHLVQAFKDQFINPASVWLWRQQLSARKQTETADYACYIRRLCKHLNLSAAKTMHYFIQGLRPNLKNHVIIVQPKGFAEAENLANLKEAVSIKTANIAQQKLEVQLASRGGCRSKTDRITRAPHVRISHQS